MLALQLEADIVKVWKGGVPISIGATAVDRQRFGTSPARHQIQNSVSLEALIIVNVTAADNEPCG
jgi:hypothetical protein